MNINKFGAFLTAVLLCSVCLAGSNSMVGKRAPDITIRQWVTDSPPNIENLAGSPYVLEFWATWCTPCVKNIPHLNKLNNKYRKEGLKFISLSQDKSAEMLSSFIKDKSINYHVAIDNGSTNWFNIEAYPTAVVVDHKGTITWQGQPWDKKFEKAIAKALAAAPPPLLATVDLGPFSHLKKPLKGGRNFAQAYNDIASYINTQNSSERSLLAEKIVETIDRQLYIKTRQADKVRVKSPIRAFKLYAELVSLYDGIDATDSARSAYFELKNNKEIKEQLLVAKNIPNKTD